MSVVAVAPGRSSDHLRARATGSALYTEDFYVPGMLFGGVARSPHAAAAIVNYDISAALAVPGVRAILTANDLPDRCWGLIKRDEPLLARGCVRYVGEPVVLAAADTPDALRAALRAVRVHYEPADAVTDLCQSATIREIRVHPDTTNVFHTATITRGGVRSTFAQAAAVVSGVYEAHRVHQGYIEPRASLAQLDVDDRLVLITSTQAPFQVRDGVTQLLDLPPDRCVVRAPAVGGGFGGKLHLGMAPYAAALCLATRRPTQVVCSRAEEMQAGNPRENTFIRIESAVDSEGRVLARILEALLDSGAYAYDTPVLTSTAALQSCGPYRVDALDAKVSAVYTNTTPTGSMRAPTGPQMVFAIEAHMNDIADRFGLSPLEIRLRNVVRDGDLGPTGQRFESPCMEECLNRVAAEIKQWRQDALTRPKLGRAKRTGWGIACAGWKTMAAPSTARVELSSDSATVYVGAPEIGTGAVSTGLKIMVGEVLGLPSERVEVIAADTGLTPSDVGSEGSRTLYGLGEAARDAARQIKHLLALAAASLLNATPEDLIFVNGQIVSTKDPEEAVDLEDALHFASPDSDSLNAKGAFQPASVPFDDAATSGMVRPWLNEATFHCHGVELDVDEETGRIAIRRYVAAHDTGHVVNPGGVVGQIEGGVVQGLGYALYEEIRRSSDGTVQNADLVDYRLPTIADIPPELKVIMVHSSPGTTGTRGIKGIGEAPVVLPPAAVAAAVRDVTGIQPSRLPLSAEVLSDLFHAHKAQAHDTKSHPTTS